MEKTILRTDKISQVQFENDLFLIHIHRNEYGVSTYEFKSREVALETFKSIEIQLNNALGNKAEFITIENHL